MTDLRQRIAVNRLGARIERRARMRRDGAGRSPRRGAPPRGQPAAIGAVRGDRLVAPYRAGALAAWKAMMEQGAARRLDRR